MIWNWVQALKFKSCMFSLASCMFLMQVKEGETKTNQWVGQQNIQV